MSEGLFTRSKFWSQLLLKLKEVSDKSQDFYKVKQSQDPKNKHVSQPLKRAPYAKLNEENWIISVTASQGNNVCNEVEGHRL